MAMIRIAPHAAGWNGRGVALLLVLAMILLIVPIAAGLARRSVLFHLEEQLSQQQRLAQSLARQLEAGPLAAWLAADSTSVVLDLQSPTPRVAVLGEQWEFEGTEYEAAITAWDQCGMTPLDSVASGSLWRSVIPGELQPRLVDLNRSGDSADAVGLDQFAGRGILDGALPSSAFPRAEDDGVSLGAWMATHPASPAGLVNVNTAPLPLIESAMLSAGRGGIEAIITARREGTPAPLPAALNAEPSNRSRTNQAPRFVAASNSWSARIDVRVGAARRSWWVVYQNRSARWECVQRLVITD